jgi:hypothetical protein
MATQIFLLLGCLALALILSDSSDTLRDMFRRRI